MSQFHTIIRTPRVPNFRFCVCTIQMRMNGIQGVRLRVLSSLGPLTGWRATRGGSQLANGPAEGDTLRFSRDAVLDGANQMPKRSAGSLRRRRIPMPWPKGRPFRILSIDGGGIRGIFSAAFLGGLEERYLSGASIAGCFDLIAGTSTGGIIALGLASGLPAAELRDIYVRRGCEMFPPVRMGALGGVERALKGLSSYFRHRYDRGALMRVLESTFSERTLGDANSRLCIPSFDGRYGEVYIFKTPHHPDYRKDRTELMTKVAAATGAAPSYFQPLRDGGYTFVDGGVWANNPVMIGLVDALTCFAVPRERVCILSLGCGEESYSVGKSKVLGGGRFAWVDIICAAMRLQSQNALGQAGLLIGADRIVRVDAPATDDKIALDDWSRASEELPEAANAALMRDGERVVATFLSDFAVPYVPIAKERS